MLYRPTRAGTICQRTFLPAFQREKDVPAEQITLTPKREKQDLETAVQLWGFEYTGQGRTNVEKYSSNLAYRIVNFLNDKPVVQDPETKEMRDVQAGDIVVLCRTNDECREIANAIRENGLQAVVADVGLNLTAEWRYLRACFSLLVDETDSLARAEIAFFNRSDHDIAAIVDDRLLFVQRPKEEHHTWLNDDETIAWLNENRSSLLSESLNGMIQLIYAGLDLFNKVM